MKRPPFLFSRFLSWCLGDTLQGSAVVGDLNEEYHELRSRGFGTRADLWFLWQAVAIGLPYLAERLIARPLVQLRSDLRFSMRSLLRSPSYLGVTAGSLILGIGVNTAIFSVVNGVLIRPLPYPDQERLIDMGEFNPAEVCEGCGLSASPATFQAWQGTVGVFEKIGASTDDQVTLGEGLGRRRVQLGNATPALLELLGANVNRGRLFSDVTLIDDIREGAVVVSEQIWRTIYGADPEIVGKTILVDSRPRNVVGVMDPGFRYLAGVDIWAPLELRDLDQHARNLWVVALTSHGVSSDEVAARLASIDESLASVDPTNHAEWETRTQPLREAFLHELGPPAAAIFLMAVALAVLLIACANIASVSGARSLERMREMSVRAALGAGRGRLFRETLTESIVLASIGGVAGIAIAYGFSGVLETKLGGFFPPWLQIGVDVRLLAFSAFVAGLTVLVAGLVPALRVSRVDVMGALRRAGYSTSSGARTVKWQALLVTLQIAMGLVLVGAATLSVRSYIQISRFDDLGYNPYGVRSVGLSLDDDSMGVSNRNSVVGSASESLEPLAAGRQVVVEQERFLGTFGPFDSASPVSVEGSESPVSNSIVPRHGVSVSPGYFELLEIPVIRGRVFDIQDERRGVGVVVVNEKAASVLWPGENALGKTMRIADENDAGVLTVVGIVGDIVVSPLQASRSGHPRIYTLFSQSPGARPTLLFRGSPGTRTEVLEMISSVQADLTLLEVSSLEEMLIRWIKPQSVAVRIMGGMSVLALVLASVGIYGMLALAVTTRRREIGIRIALGSTHWGVARLIMTRVAFLFAVGALLGLGGSSLLSGLGGAMGITLGTNEIGTLLNSVAILALVCLIAAGRPLLDAVRTNPSLTTRGDG